MTGKLPNHVIIEQFNKLFPSWKSDIQSYVTINAGKNSIRIVTLSGGHYIFTYNNAKSWSLSTAGKINH